MWLDNCFPDRKEGPPSEEAYRKACLKVPVEMVIEAAVENHRHLVGTKFKVRLVRTIGTSKLRSRVLITTLLDEKLYKWFDLVRLYLQRWRIRPKICQFPSSIFTRCKSTQRQEEFRRCEAVKEDMILLGIAYGMISPKSEKVA